MEGAEAAERADYTQDMEEQKPPRRNLRDLDLKIVKKKAVKSESENGTVINYQVVARDKTGNNKIVIWSAYAFDELNAKDSIIRLVIQNSQKTLSEFLGKKDKKKVEDKDIQTHSSLDDDDGPLLPRIPMPKKKKEGGASDA